MTGTRARRSRRPRRAAGRPCGGSYSVALPDGRIQHVTYVADHTGGGGYNAHVTYEGAAHHPPPVHGYPTHPAPYHTHPAPYHPRPAPYRPAPVPYKPEPVSYESEPVSYEPEPVSYESESASYETEPASYEPESPSYEPESPSYQLPLEPTS